MVAADMVDALQRIIAWLMNRVRLNRIHEGLRDGKPVIVKRRRIGAGVVIWLGNQFLNLADGGVHMFVRADEWVDWEVHCCRLLYPERPAASAGPGPSVVVPKVGGSSLRQRLQNNAVEVKAFIAAAHELVRVHQIPCSHYQAAWSHGDLHLDNIVYDPAADRAVLIDFDTRHDRTVGPTRRHGDDLKVFLLELIAWPGEQWQQLATAVIEEYGEPSVLAELEGQLLLPRGFAKVLWHTRTNCRATRRIEERMQALRSILQRFATPSTGFETHSEEQGLGCETANHRP